MTKRIQASLGAAAVAALVMAVFSVSGHAAEMSANVPFSFTVNGATLPPGQYFVETNDSRLIIRGVSRAALALSNALQSSDYTSAKLVFHKYGEEYILREVWTGGSSGRSLAKTQRERELARGEGSHSKTASFERVEVPVF